MKKENHIFKTLPNFMIRTAMLPLESMNKIKTKHKHLSSLEQFLNNSIMREALLIASPN